MSPCKAGLIAIACCFAFITPACSYAKQTVALHVGLIPEKLGEGTTIEFGFRINAPPGEVPTPLTGIGLSYPAHIGIVTSGIGIKSCGAATLEMSGPEGCPAEALMGYGTATGEIKMEGEVIQEHASTNVFMAPFNNGDIELLFYVNGGTPLSTQLLFPGLLLPATPPFGGTLAITVPLLESFPEGPDIAIVNLQSSIGPLGITYYNHIHRKFVPYHPSGIVLPPSCPKGGFPFSAKFAFANGEYTVARARVACPHKRAAK